MEDYMEHNFTEWAYQLWEENCEEHESFNEKHITFEDYCRKNKQFLHDEYIKEKDKERGHL